MKPALWLSVQRKTDGASLNTHWARACALWGSVRCSEGIEYREINTPPVVLLFSRQKYWVACLKDKIWTWNRVRNAQYTIFSIQMSIINGPLGPLQVWGLTHWPATTPVLRWSSPLFATEFPYFVPPSNYSLSPSSRTVFWYPLCYTGGHKSPISTDKWDKKL